MADRHALPLTIPEAADALAVSDKTIRRMLKAGILEEQTRDAAGRILITAHSVEVGAAQLGRKAIGWPEQSTSDTRSVLGDRDDESAALAQPLQMLRDILEGQLRERDRRIEELQGELADVKAAQKYLPLLEEAERARLAQLERELADTRAALARYQASGEPVQTTDQASRQTDRPSVMRRMLRLLGRG
jgi:DNA-binding transcriptional MerR regulator